MSSSLIHSAVTIMTPLLFAALGGLFTELGGMLTIALDGLLLTGAFAGVVFAHWTGSLLGGALFGGLAGMTLAAAVGGVTLKLKANVFITGLAANLFAGGITVVLGRRLFATRGVVVFNDLPRLPVITLPVIDGIPILGDLLSGHTPYVYASWGFLAAAWFMLYRTPQGFRLRGCEKSGEALESLGLKPDRLRFAAFLISGFVCGLGGSYLTLNLQAFVPQISAGKGWIALVVIFLGGRRPQGLWPAAFLFGLAEAFSNFAQGAFNVPADFILAIPHLWTLLVMIGVSIYTKNKRAFAGLAQDHTKSHRTP
ncbi:MAG: ABC transporter permease [Spirochaetales bacterium]|jgi:simple sugar transport system permease protein|nr:ABC transporter permease [Spirochaetales bacterium]